MKTLRAIAALLTYPSSELLAARGEFMEAIRAEGWLSANGQRKVGDFLDYLNGGPLEDLQEAYVDLFDRTPSLSLYLFEHVHGDSRDRGQALVELDSLYREKNLENASEHTPDYLPLFLEYLSVLTPGEARENLEAAVDIISILEARLKTRQSPYHSLLGALEDLAARKPDPKKVSNALAVSDGRVPTHAEMDEAWEQQFALAPVAEAGAGGCPRAEDIVKRMEAVS